MAPELSIAYEKVSDLYDAYVRTALDVPFFLDATRGAPGPVLELMCGTGRVSLPLLEAGVRLVCVDRCGPLLEKLRQKLEDRRLSDRARVVECDVRVLALGERFELAILPFHAFSELLTTEDQRLTLQRVRDHLSPRGRFICTFHNPPVRLAAADGRLRLVSSNRLPDGGSLAVFIAERLDADTGVVSGVQVYEDYAPDGVLRAKRLIELHFTLPALAQIEPLAREAGLAIASVLGDYAGAPYVPATSPFMLVTMERA